MRLLHRYIASSFFATFVMALLILSFVMSVGLLFKVTQYIARGMSFSIVMDFLWEGIPTTLSYSIPIAALVSALLVFGRLSSDSEISAMRAGGISLTQIMHTPVLIALLLSVFCLYLNNDVAPDSAYMRSSMRRQLKASDVTALIEPGKYVEIGAHSVYVGRREDNKLIDLRITETTKSGHTKEIRAREAILFSTNEVATLDMRDVTVDPIQEGQTGIGKADRVVYTIGDLEKNSDKSEPMRPRRVKDKFTRMLFKDLAIAKEFPPTTEKGIEDISRARVEIHYRICFSLACVCFVMVGIPLGIQQHRKESSAGIATSLGIAGGFYLFCMAAQSLAKNPTYHAHYIVWIPVVICIVTSIVFTAKNN